MTEVMLETVWLLFICKKYIGGFQMIELVNVKDMDKVKHLPIEVQNGILEALQVLDED